MRGDVRRATTEGTNFVGDWGRDGVLARRGKQTRLAKGVRWRQMCGLNESRADRRFLRSARGELSFKISHRLRVQAGDVARRQATPVAAWWRGETAGTVTVTAAPTPGQRQHQSEGDQRQEETLGVHGSRSSVGSAVRARG